MNSALAPAAFMKLLAAGSDLQARRRAHREYREATQALLDLQLQHNRQLQNRPGLLKRWDIETLARPLVQQTMIEADLADASGKLVRRVEEFSNREILGEYLISVHLERNPLPVARRTTQ